MAVQVGVRAGICTIAVPTLIRRLTDTETRVRREVACALGRIGKAAEPALPALEKLTRGQVGEVADAARAAIDAIRGDA